MSDLKVFENAEFGEIRTIEENGKVLFCGSDVAKALGYTNTRKAISDHCRCVTKRYVPHPQSPDKQIEMSFIPEGDVYRLITHSKLPAAEQFEKWVFDEVLPSIRKHGMYAVDDLITNPDLAIAAFTALKEEREKNKALQTTIAVQEQQITELKPKASYYDVVLNCKDLLSTTNIAKDYGKSAKWLNELLHKHKIQFKQGDVWTLYQKYAKCGYTGTKTRTYNNSDGTVHIKVYTYWTQKGRLFIYKTLKKLNILPIIEQTEKAA